MGELTAPRPPTRTLVLLLSGALLGSMLAVVTPPQSAHAAGTVLFENVFNDNTVDGTGSASVPTPVSGTNTACLSAAGNTTTAPLYSCTTSTDAQGSGKLRMTSATTNQVGGVYGATSFPTSSGLDVTFNTYQYGGGGADGMSFVLAAVDPANPIAPTAIGPGGGSLGYSPAGSVKGLPNAYLGVGLDVYGNFSSTGFQGTGCTANSNISAQEAGAIVVRGPGNNLAGYCGLATTYTGVATSKVTLRATTRAASVVPVQVLINPTASSFTSDTGVSVAAGTYKVVATPVGGTAKTLTGALPTVSSSLYTSSSYLTAAGIPKQLAFGFIGSTGSVTDFHEASNVKVVTFNAVPQLAVATTSYVATSPALGAPVNYVVTPSVQSGVDVGSAMTMTQTVPAGVTPVGAFGSGWVCAAPSGQTVTCTTSATSFANGTTLPPVNVVGIVSASGMTATTVQTKSTSAVSAGTASPASVASTTAGTLPTAPSGITLSPATGSISGGGTVTLSGTGLTTATAIEIGTSAEQNAGTPVVLLPCSSVITTRCFTVSGNNLVVSSWPSRSTTTAVGVTVVTQGVAGSATYTYAASPAAPATPTATAGLTSATLSWTAPANNGSAITGYLVTPYLNGVAQTPVSYDASTTTRTLTGLSPGDSYTFTVAAVNGFGTSATSSPSAAVVPYTLPGAPTGTSAAAGTGQATVTWTAPSSNGGSPITGYVVTPYVGGVAQTPVSFSGTATTQTVPGLTAGTSYTFRVAAVNVAGTGPASAASTAVVPNAAPGLSFPAPPAGEVGVGYTDQLSVTNGTAPYSWAVSSGALPAGLTLSAATGLISGTPTTAGSSTFTVQVTDASGATASRAATISIAAAPSVTFAPAAGEVSVPYSQQAGVSGGTGPYTWSISAGSLPAGLTINPTTGLVSGTPTASGTFSVTVAATDAFGVTATRTAALVIAALPAFSGTAPAAAQVGVAYTAALDVAGGTAPLTWSVTAGSLPPGLTLNAGTGALTGTPTTQGSYPFSVAVTDAFNQTATRTVTLVVNAGPLVITKTANVSSAAPGGVVSYTVTVANTGTQTLPVTLTDPLAGVLDDAAYNGDAAASAGTVSYASGTLSWSGSVAAGSTVTVTYSVTVADPDTGNKVLANTVTSSTLGTNCAAGSVDPRCTRNVTVSGLTITKRADTATTTPGSTVSYTIVATNSGQTPYVATSFTDPLAGVLDDATYNSDAAATGGAVAYSGSTLTWTGNLAVGATVTLRYSVRVNDPDTGNRSLANTVTSSAAGSSCPAGNPATGCTATVTVLVPALNVTNTSSVTSTTPGSTVPYTVTIANTGQTPYLGTSVAVALAGALDDATYNGDAAAGAGAVSYAGGSSTLTWTGDLAVGASVTVTYSVSVRNPDPGDRTLTTVASSAAAGSTCPTGSANATCTSTVSVLVPALTTTVTSDVSSTIPGSTVHYTVVVANTGQTAYTGATVTAALGGVLDDAVYANDAAATSGTVGVAGSALTWTGNLAVGASATITYSVTVADPDAGDRSLVSRLSSTTPFGNCPTGSADPRCASTVAVLLPALSLAVTADPASTTPGGTVRYTVSATNTGQTAYTGVPVLVSLPGVLDDAAYHSDASASTGTVTRSGTTLTWTLSLASAASATLTFTVTVDDPDGGDRSLAASVSSTAAGSTCTTASTDSPCQSTVPVLLPGLLITKTADATTTQPGQSVGFTVTVLNNGQTTQTAARVTDSLAQLLNDASYSGDAAATVGSVAYAGSTLTWTGTLAPGASAVITFTVRVNDPDTGDQLMVNTVSSTAPGNNCAAGSTDPRCTAVVRVLVPGLTITKTATAAYGTPGTALSYTVTATNTGATDYATATWADDLSGVLDDATYAGDAAASTGSVSLSGSTLRWTGALARGASASVTYSVTVATAAGGDNRLANTVTSTSPGSNCPVGSADPRCSVTVPVARLLIAQAYTETSTTPGSLVHLTATFTNTGQYPYTGITITSPNADTIDDATPTGDQTATSGSLSLSSTAITWTGTIAPGQTVTITGTLTVHNPDTGNKLLTGTLTTTAAGSNCAPDTTDPRCTANLPVLLPALTITKTANTTFVTPGGTATYTITATNTGQTPYTGATLTDSLAGVLDDATYPDNATATTGTLTYTAPTLTWTGDLPIGATATITYSVTATTPSHGDKTMINPVASTTTGSTCPPATGNPACHTTVAVLTPALTITKTADVPNANLGAKVTYTVTVVNSGQTPYAAAAFTDPLGDVLDDADYTTAATASSGTVALAGQTLSWSGPLAVGASATVSYAVTVKNPDPANRSLVNTVVSSTPGVNCTSGSGDPRCTTTVAVTNSTTVVFTKTASAAYAAPGSTLTYTVRVDNTALAGPGVAAGFTDPLADVLDDATYNNDATATAGTVTFDGGTSTLGWSTGLLPTSSTVTITYSVTVKAAISGDQVLANTVTGTSDTASNNCPVGSADPRCSVTVPVARLLIAQAYTETSTTPGSLVHLTATFTNTGQYPYTGITITSPNADTIDDATPTGDQTATSGSLSLSSTAITWTGTIAPGQTVTITGTLTVHNPDTGNKLLTGTLTTTAAGSNCAPDTTDPRCTANLPVLLPALTITKTANTTFVTPGGTATYTITATNTGQTPYTGATLTDSLAGVLDDATYPDNATATTGTLTYTAPTLTWTGDLPIGATATITYSVTATTPSHGDKTMINPVASTTTGSTCPPATGNPACHTTVAVLTPALTITSSASRSSAVPGDAVTFTVVARNSGQTPYAAAALSVPLTGLTDDATYNGDAGATVGTVALAGQTLSWSGPLAVGASVTVTYSVTVTAPDPGDHRLTTTVASTAVGSNCPAGGDDPRCGLEVPVAGLLVTNAADVATAQPTGVVQYRGTFTNTGQVPYYGVTVTDDLTGALDDAVYNVDATASSGTLVIVTGSGHLVWTGDIPVGATVTVTGSVTVRNPDPADQVLTTALSTEAVASNCPTGGSDPQCRTSTTVLTPRLTITKTADTTTTTPGDRVTYTVTIANTGQTPYAGAVVRDALGGGLDDAVYSGNATATRGQVQAGATDLTWTGDLAVGETAVVVYSIDISSPPTGDGLVVNSVFSDEVGSSCPPGSSNPACTVTVTVLVPALSVALTPDVSTTTPGSRVTYTLTVANPGQTPALGTTVTTALAGVLDDATYAQDAAASSGSVSLAAGQLSWTGDLAVGATAVVTFSVLVSDPDAGDRQLVSSVSSAAAGSSCPPGAPCTATVSVLVPGLAVSLAADAATATPGDRVRLTLDVRNTGETPYASTTVTVPLTGVLDDALVDGSPTATSGAASVQGGSLVWTGDLAVGAATSVVLAVVVRGEADLGDHRLTATAVSTAAGSSCPAGGDSAACSAVVRVLVPRLTLSKTADRATATPGQLISYRIVVSNDGETPYAAATVTDALTGVLSDAAYGNDATVTGGGVLSYTTGTLTWTGALPVGASATITYTATVNNPDRGDRNLVNVVSSSDPGSTCPVGSTNPDCTARVQVLVPALTITKSTPASTVVAGSAVTYTIVATNTGETPYAPAVVTDDLSGILDDATYAGDAAATVGTVQVTNGVLVWSGPLARGDTVTITYSAQVAFPATGDRTLRNVVSSPSQGATCTTRRSGTACRTSTQVLVPALAVSKSADTSRVVAGEQVSYTLQATNTGEADYPAATLTDALAGVLDDATYDGNATATTGAVSVTGGTLTWSGALRRGDSVVVTYSVTALPQDPGDGVLRNGLSSASVGSTCPTADAALACRTATTVEPSVLSLTGLTPSFTLTGLPGATVTLDNAVSMTVTTNNRAGYTVTARALDSALRAAGPSGDVIPIDRLRVRESGTGPFVPLRQDQTLTVHGQDRASGPGGDAVSNDYQVQIPFVGDDRYSTTVEYVATTQ